MIENWIDIPGYEGLYKVSDLGRVYSESVKRLIKPNKIQNGYLRVGLSSNKIRKKWLIHHLVCISFLSYRVDSNLVVDHIDGDKSNNTINNLQIISQRLNVCKYFDSKGINVGAYYNKKTGKYRSRIYVNGKNIHLGLFTEETESIKAYQDAIKKYNLI